MGEECFSRDFIPKIPSGTLISTWVSCCCPEEDASSCTCCIPCLMPALSRVEQISHMKRGLLRGTGFPEAADSTVMWNWYLNQGYRSISWSPAETLVLHASNLNQKASPLALKARMTLRHACWQCAVWALPLQNKGCHSTFIHLCVSSVMPVVAHSKHAQ